MKKPTKLTTALLLAMAVNSSYASERCFPPVGEIPTLPEVLECFQSVQDTQRQQLSELKAENQALLQLILSDGLVAHYPFDGDANDVSGHENHGTVKGATLTVDRFGNPNSAYHFDGNNLIAIEESDSLDITGNMTIALWVQPDENCDCRR